MANAYLSLYQIFAVLQSFLSDHLIYYCLHEQLICQKQGIDYTLLFARLNNNDSSRLPKETTSKWYN